jgi:hypothetical protein
MRNTQKRKTAMPQAEFEPAIQANERPPRSAAVFILVASTDSSEVSNRTNRAASIDVCQLIQGWSIVWCRFVSVVRMAAIVPTV